MIRLLPFLFILLTVSQGFAQNKVASTNPKAWLNQISTTPPGPFKAVKPMHLSYQLSWKGKINAGKMEFAITEPHPGVYQATSKGQSSGLARALYQYNFSGTSQTNADTLKPLTFNFADKTKNKQSSYSILFQPSQMISETDVKDLKSGVVTPYRRVYRFEKDVGMDLMSSILYMRSQPLNKGDRLSLVTATFNKPYLAEFEVLGRERKSIKGKRFNTIKMDMKISKVHSNMTIEPYSKIKQATIWVSDDSYRIPVEFQGEIFIGYISSRLVSRRWL